MKNFERLYTFDKTGKIRIFDCFVQVDESGINPQIITQTGIIDGRFITSIKEIREGKNIGKTNETTPLEQAISECQSKWNDKLDEGYKSDKMCIEKYTYGFEKCYNSGLIRYNTNAEWDEKPMLAEPYKKSRGMKFPVYLQPKLNGVRCMAKLKDGRVVLMSRGGKYYKLPHIEAHLMNYFYDNPTHILDGELFTKGRSLQEIAGVCREEAGLKDKSWVEYHIYDLAKPVISQQGRFAELDLSLDLDNNGTNYPIKRVETISVNTSERIKELHDVWVRDGYEGAIIRQVTGTYQFGFRDKVLIKVKEFIDEEFTLIGCKVTEGKTIGDSFVFELLNNLNNLTFFARPKGTREQKENWYNTIYDWQGKKATVRYQERTEDGLPHQAHVVIIRDYE